MKHVRAIMKQLRAEFPGIEIEQVRYRTHLVYELRWGGCTRNLTIATSPKNTDHCITNAIHETRAFFRNAHAPYYPPNPSQASDPRCENTEVLH